MKMIILEIVMACVVGFPLAYFLCKITRERRRRRRWDDYVPKSLIDEIDRREEEDRGWE